MHNGPNEDSDQKKMGIERSITLTISFCSLLFTPEILAGSQLTASPNDICAEKRCSQNGPAVRFPFVLLREKQSVSCGYNSSYNLYCDKTNLTILEFPFSTIKFSVTDIDYSSQTIQVGSPYENCFAKHLREFDKSAILPFLIIPSAFNSSHFDYYLINSFSIQRYSLFNCSSPSGDDYATDVTYISCLDNHDGYQVYATPLNSAIMNLPGKWCTKMYDTNEISSEMVDSPFVMHLSWALPACKSCETQGGICRWENGTKHHQIGCFGWKKHHYDCPGTQSELAGKSDACQGCPNQEACATAPKGPDPGISRILRISGPIIGCLFLIILAASIIYVVYSTNKDKDNQMRIKKFLEDYTAMKPTRYSYADIKRITNDCRDKLGEGGFGNVYKGKISNEIYVAVKLLHDSTGNGDEFINEVGTMGTIHHVNVVRLLGFCADGSKRALVYEYLPNGSLDKFIFPKGEEQHTLGMARLQDIAIGIARGIQYLHQGCEQRILHFDIKPHNILLDHSHNPKISDFGLAKLCEKGRSAVSMTAARGTMGYIAPEVFSRHFGNVSYKSDIYSFGMLLLEMVGRRKNIDTTVQNVSQVYFPEWIYGRLVDGEEWRVRVEEDGEDKITRKLAIVGLWCIQWNPVDRPSITAVLQMLEGSGESLSLPRNPFTSGNATNPDDQVAPLASRLEVISE